MKKFLIGTLSLAVAMSLNANVYATVDGKEIQTKDIAIAIGGNMAYAGEVDKLPEDTKKKIIDQTINRQLLIKQARKDGIEKDKEFLEILDTYKDGIVLDVWMKKQYDGIKINEKDMKKIYEEKSENFMQPAQVKAKHILVKTEDEAKALIKDLSKIKSSELEAKFEELAKEKSIDPSAKENGGSLGWFEEAQMVGPFSEAAFAMKKGEITKEPIQTQFGYHIIYKEDAKASEKVKFEDAKAQLEGSLKMEKFREFVDAKTEELRKKAKIEYK